MTKKSSVGHRQKVKRRVRTTIHLKRKQQMPFQSRRAELARGIEKACRYTSAYDYLVDMHIVVGNQSVNYHATSALENLANSVRDVAVFDKSNQPDLSTTHANLELNTFYQFAAAAVMDMGYVFLDTVSTNKGIPIYQAQLL